MSSGLKCSSLRHLNGHISDTNSQIKVSEITLKLDVQLAWALCNLLTDRALESSMDRLESTQVPGLANLGISLGRMIDHPSTNNGGEQRIRV